MMGCYGIGVGRLMSSVMEVRNDNKGPIWPMSISPWHVQLIALQTNKSEVIAAADKIYNDLTLMDIEVLFDDRDDRPGVKFADADLLGIPLRINISNRHLPSGMVEFQYRAKKGESAFVPIAQAANQAKKFIETALRDIDDQADRLTEKTQEQFKCNN
ncbi:MAG: hypothetical protein OMM_11168 [Candidatus Magnetoglobus multicellularis str. Araruama]|uniref:Anticodon-binding domain-containing protein n=1 Tax=Candidatus Magnetoglobus multicellularis str. Araruama TaxID=890399 RepID=A0A1V1NZ93_9BACT|nr:MAG: hypothetical protein OMM_11168 [Candidatus Magnetoglobus multicellularis str. Araruama]